MLGMGLQKKVKGEPNKTNNKTNNKTGPASLGADNFKPLHFTLEITSAMYQVLSEFADMKGMSVEDYCEDALQYAGQGEKIHFNVQSSIVLDVEARPSAALS